MKRLTLVCLLYLGFPNSIFSQFSPQKVISEQSAFYARHIAPADIDQDGDMDVFAFNDGEPDFLSWHENDGEGNFINRTIIGDGLDNTYRIKVLDINDDAAPDLITIRTTEDFSIEEIRLFQNDGNGNFTDQVIFSGRVLIMSVDFVDLNNDRILDLLMVQDFDRYELAYYPNDQNYPLEQSVQSVQLKELTNDDDLRFTLADFDMDGRMDVMEINHKKKLDSVNISWRANLGVAGLGISQPLLTFESTANIIEHFQIRDVNGDRLPDLLFSESFIDENQAFDNNVYWARNLAEAGFSTPITIDEYTEQFGVEFQLVDFDQDQDLDIFYGFLMAESVATWLENDGFGSFTKQTQIINFNVSTPYYVDLHFTHINSDTHLDIAMSVSSLRWLPGDATQQYNEVRKVEFPFGVIPAITVDYDDDNDLDVIEYYPQNEPHSIFLSRNNGDGSFSSAVPIAETDQQLKQVEITDLDGDGFKDILVNPEGLRSDFIVYYGKPDGSYDPPSVLQANVGSTFFQVSDIDQNGTPDIIYGHAVETDIMELEILVNQGAKNYTRQNLTTLTVLQPAEQVAIGDYDGDGRLDIIFEAITGTGKKLFLLKQESALVFTEIDMNVAGLQGFLSQGVQGIDLNQNGKTTFLSRNYSSENNTTTISIIPNEIGQPLVPIVEYSGSALYLPVDYNQDQKVDILYLGGEDVNAVDLRLWSSSLNSYQEIIVQEELPYNTLRMMMADFDNDNDDDLLVNYTKVFDGNFGLISWYENFMELPTIAGQAYWDTNSNGQLDEGEKGLGFVQTFLEPNAQSSFTDQAGNFQYFVGKGEYQLFVQPPDSCWEATTPTALQIQVADEPIETINFGFQNVGSTRSLNTNVRSGVTRCGFQVPFWLNLVNDGCLSQNADLQLVLSDGASLISADIMPSLINQDTLSWILGQLEPVETKQFQLLLQMPGVEAIGDSISITALAYNSDGTLADTYIYKSEIRCAYDPNDKLVNPNRGGDNNYALFSETMEYTIRFQNTGNDTAFTVEIIDTIHPNLDLATLQPLNASHDFTTLIDERSRTVTFRFENILLPDSTTNEPLSHGYVSFSIESMEDLEERSIIENRAGIYFDFNPPIITNTVSNTLVTTIPVDVTSVRVGGFEGMRVGVFPNPFEDIVQLRVEAERQERLQLRVFDLLGRVVVNESLTIRKGEQAITIEALSNLPSGTYLIQLANAQQQWSDKIIKSR